MCEADGNHSRSHGLTREMIQAQALAMDTRIIQQPTDRNEYEKNLKNVIALLKTEGVTAGVFGDIYLNEHRVWIERVCSEMQIEPVFPLWGCNTTDLLKEFITVGFKAMTVSVRCDMLSQHWLGRQLDQDFLDEIGLLPGIDPCAENGEYHTFVYDGPVFKNPVNFSKGLVSQRDNHYFLELNS